jgi:hypothetical protein
MKKLVITEDLENRVMNDQHITDEISRNQKLKGRSKYVFNDKTHNLETFGLRKYKSEFYPQTVYFLTPEEVESFHQEEIRVYNLLKKLDKAKETIIKYMESVVRKKLN